jgi:hypothetical protein
MHTRVRKQYTALGNHTPAATPKHPCVTVLRELILEASPAASITLKAVNVRVYATRILRLGLVEHRETVT